MVRFMRLIQPFGIIERNHLFAQDAVEVVPGAARGYTGALDFFFWPIPRRKASGSDDLVEYVNARTIRRPSDARAVLRIQNRRGL
jgi:hypothetical protein